MADPRVTQLAEVLVHYSTKVREGDTVSIIGDAPAEPLMLAVYEAVLRAGGLPAINVTLTGQKELLFDVATQSQLEWIPPSELWGTAEADVSISLTAPDNTRELSRFDPARQALVQRARTPMINQMMQRSSAGDLRWVDTQFPTQALAAEAQMSLRQYEELFYAACLTDKPDAIGAWRRQSNETDRLAEWIQGREEVHITGRGTDLRLSVAGRTFVAGNGTFNMPDGEFFTGPVEDSANGEISFHLPAIYSGREVSGVRFQFRDGKVVDASADHNEDYLIALLDSDPGARFLGELGIGTNFGIDRGTRSILMDEKIGGTAHLAIGQSYAETGGVNESSLHWDMICDLRDGGQVTVDGMVLLRDGAFVV